MEHGPVFWRGRKERLSHSRSLFERDIERMGSDPRVSGPKSKVTEDLYHFAHSLDAREEHGTERAFTIYRRMRRRMERVPVSLRKLTKFYASRSAHEIAASYTLTPGGRRKFVVPVLGKEEEERHGLPVHGCVDISTLLASVFRIVGMPAEVLRENLHTYVVFREVREDGRLGQEWKLDPLPISPSKFMVRMDDDERAAVDARMRAGLAARGLDHGSIGINGIDDFARYGEPGKKEHLKSVLKGLRRKG